MFWILIIIANRLTCLEEQLPINFEIISSLTYFYITITIDFDLIWNI